MPNRNQTKSFLAIPSVLVLMSLACGLIGADPFSKVLSTSIAKVSSPNDQQAAVTVNGESSTMQEFQMQVKVARQQLINQYIQYLQLAAMFGLDPSSDPQISQTLNQITDELNTPSTLGLQIIDDMVNDLLIRQYAKKNGITVTAADVEKAAQEALQYYQNGTPTPTPSPTAIVYPTLDATQLALVSPTPASQASPTRTPDLAENGTLGTSLTPTGTPYTLSGYQTQYQRALDTYIALGINEATFRKIFFESALYRQRVSDIVTANVGHVQEQVWARNILVPDEGTAESILKQLQAGANFASLADQYSTNPNTNKGGDLGWFGKGTMDDAIEKAAFALQVGEISQPVKTVSGWEIIQVLGHESRALTETEYTTVVAAAFTQWLATQRSASNVTTSSNWANNVPNQPSLQNALDELYGTPTATSNQAP